MLFSLHQSSTNFDFRFGRQASSPLQARAASALQPAHGVLTFLHAAIHAINKALFMTSSFHSHNIIFIFIWNLCKAMFLFQLIIVLLISITFYTYLANIVFFSCDLDFRLLEWVNFGYTDLSSSRGGSWHIGWDVVLMIKRSWDSTLSVWLLSNG